MPSVASRPTPAPEALRGFPPAPAPEALRGSPPDPHMRPSVASRPTTAPEPPRGFPPNPRPMKLFVASHLTPDPEALRCLSGVGRGTSRAPDGSDLEPPVPGFSTGWARILNHRPIRRVGSNTTVTISISPRGPLPGASMHPGLEHGVIGRGGTLQGEGDPSPPHCMAWRAGEFGSAYCREREQLF